MPFSSDREPAPPIGGAIRTELIRDLALGELDHDQLAVKYERSPDAIHQFSSRSKDEIRRAEQALVADTSK